MMKQIFTILLISWSFFVNAQTNEIFIKDVKSNEIKIGETYLIGNSIRIDSTKTNNNSTYEFWTKTKMYIMEIGGIRYENASLLVRTILDCKNKLGNTYDIIVLSENGNFISATNFDNSSKELEPLGNLLTLISEKICLK